MSQSLHDALEAVPEDLWLRARRAPARLLLLDLDGTLAPFTADRRAARPLAGARIWLERIGRLSLATEIGIVSGRPISEMLQLLPGWPGLFVGEHGWETRGVGQGTDRIELDTEAAAALAHAAHALRRAAPGIPIERRRCSLVALRPPAAEAPPSGPAGPPEPAEIDELVTEVWEPATRDALLALRPSEGGLELRITGQDRGLAVDRLRAVRWPRPLVVYLGDEESDEDAFRVVRPHGFGLRVGGTERASLAQGRLEGPEAVSLFLAAWWLRVEAPTSHPAASPLGSASYPAFLRAAAGNH